MAKCKRVSRANAVHKSGKKKGKLKKGCRYLKGDGAQCCPAGSTKSSRRSKRKTKRKSKRKVTGAARRARKGVKPNTPLMNDLNEGRRMLKRASSCKDKTFALKLIRAQMYKLMRKPAKPKRGESAREAANRRNQRYASEFVNKTEKVAKECRKQPRSIAPDYARFQGLAGPRSGKHPCTRANPPAWCG